MNPNNAIRPEGQLYFRETPPLEETKRLAIVHGCDIGIPNDAGVGNILMYTRVVDDLARMRGRPLVLLTGRLDPPIGTVDDEISYPLWQNNPFVESIVDANSIDPQIMIEINDERENLCQFTHMIENIAYHYGLRPRILRPALYLSQEEQLWALHRLSEIRRPIICLHPHGTSSPKPGHPWHEENWQKLLERLNDYGSVIEIHKAGTEVKSLETIKIKTTLRQMMSLVWASDVFVGFDSAVAHIATAFELPSVVLWEPVRKVELEEPRQAGFATAALSRWSYPQNHNLLILGDRDDTIINVIMDRVRNILNLLRT